MGLREALKKADWNQNQLANELGVSRQLVNNWCNTHVPAERAIEVARVLEVSLYWIRPDLWAQIDDRR